MDAIGVCCGARANEAATIDSPSALKSEVKMDRRSAIKHVVGAIGAASFWDAESFANQQAVQGSHRIQTTKITAYIDNQGELTGLVLTPGRESNSPIRAAGRTALAGCEVRKITSKRRADGGIEFAKQLVHTSDGQIVPAHRMFFRRPSRAAFVGRLKSLATDRPGALRLKRISRGRSRKHQNFGRRGETAGRTRTLKGGMTRWFPQVLTSARYTMARKT